MGNRAVITSKKEGKRKLGLYLHWNGGKDSVQPFLAYAKAKGVRGVDSDPSYCYARLAQIIGNFMGTTLSLGIIIINDEDASDPGDNGIYHITDSFDIVGRGDRCEQSEHDFDEMVNEINNSQPEKERMTQKELDKFMSEYKKTHDVVIKKK